MNALDLLMQDEARSKRIAPFVAKVSANAEVQARYEAAYWNLNRSYLPGYIQGARQDIDSMSREEILRRVRYFRKNSEVMQKALSVLCVNVVGTGINPTPATTKEEWNKRALDWWENSFVPVADYSGESSLYELQGISYEAEKVDGDHGLELRENENGRPALDLVEAHRITSAGLDPKIATMNGQRAADGIIIGPNKKPLFYAVADEFDQRVISLIPASRFVFFYNKRRAGQYRGISQFHSAIMTLHDLDDLQKYEMAAAKDASAKSTKFKSAAGASTVDGFGIGRSLNQGQQITPGQKADYYKNAISGETVVLYPGDDMEQYRSDRPSSAMSGFWDQLEMKFAKGSGLSYAALVDYQGNWGGATLRAAVTGDNRLFSLETLREARKWQRVWEYAIGWAQDHGELEKNPEYRKVRWHPPRRTTVDIGNESAATLNELKAGTKTYEGIYGECGDDWRERLIQRANEEAFINKIAAERGLDPVRIASFAQERVTIATQGQDPEAEPNLPAGKSKPKPAE